MSNPLISYRIENITILFNFRYCFIRIELENSITKSFTDALFYSQ